MTKVLVCYCWILLNRLPFRTGGATCLEGCFFVHQAVEFQKKVYKATTCSDMFFDPTTHVRFVCGAQYLRNLGYFFTNWRCIGSCLNTGSHWTVKVNEGPLMNRLSTHCYKISAIPWHLPRSIYLSTIIMATGCHNPKRCKWITKNVLVFFWDLPILWHL